MLTFDVLEALISGACATASIGEYVSRVIFPGMKRKRDFRSGGALVLDSSSLFVCK